MKNNIVQKSDKKSTMQVRLDSGFHRLLKISAAKSGRTLKNVLEECIAEYLGSNKKQA